MAKKKLRGSSLIQDIYYNLQSWAVENKIYHKFLKLNNDYPGFVYYSIDKEYLIFIDENLPEKTKKEVYCSELNNIIKCDPKISYIIDTNIINIKAENQNDNYISEIVKTTALFFDQLCEH